MDGQSALARDIGVAVAKISPVAGFIAAKATVLDLQTMTTWASLAANVAAAAYASAQLALLVRKWRREKRTS